MTSYPIPPALWAEMQAVVQDYARTMQVSEEESWRRLEATIEHAFVAQVRALVAQGDAEAERRILYGTGDPATMPVGILRAEVERSRECVYWRGPSRQQIEDAECVDLPDLRDELA